MTETRTPSWTSTQVGSARVTFGQPFYGKRKIIANAPLSRNGFRDLIEALQQAEKAYSDG